MAPSFPDPANGEGQTIAPKDTIEAVDERDAPTPEIQDNGANNSNPSALPAEPENANNLADQEYLVKTIEWELTPGSGKHDARIITQNKNGPCPLVAICNVLLLRGDLEILPPDRKVVSFKYLVERLGDYLVNHAPADKTDNEVDSPTILSSSPITLTGAPADELAGKMPKKRQSTTEYVLTYRHNLDTALSILPRLQTGLDVNARFSSIRDFEPTAELAMFDLFGVELVHGWIADPQDEETYRVVVEKCGSYNAVVECIVQGDDLSSGTVSRSNADADDKIHEGLVASEFLKDTASQLTFFGIELLRDTLPRNQLCVLFRNDHFSTLYKHPATEQLYILVTDAGYVDHQTVVWENLNDLDQTSSQFFNGVFAKPSLSLPDPVPGDENTERDYALALSLQKQEQERADAAAAARRSPSRRHQETSTSNIAAPSQRLHQSSKTKKKQDCVIC